MRRGLLGKGALLTLTSNAARTSPVARGKWFLQTFLGVSPPDPPPNVPAIKDKPVDSTGNAKVPTMRETMEAHHTNPTCASCHKIFEPIGLGMENFDAIGSWRTQDGDSPIDPTGVLVDGTKIEGIASLRDSLVRRSDQFARVVTEKMLTYALGRGVEYQDMPTVRSDRARFGGKASIRFTSIVMGIVKSAPFQTNMKTHRIRRRGWPGLEPAAGFRDAGQRKSGSSRVKLCSSPKNTSPAEQFCEVAARRWPSRSWMR